MPQLLRVGPYVVCFWSNEGSPLEPVHVHIAMGRAEANATKPWITSAGKVLLCINDSRIPDRQLRRLTRLVEANADAIVASWIERFGEAKYYC